ncbi:MAG TPA: phage/plasmid primase, P4 family [Candidatus Binatia bacterium]|nr:phage/plasmid primase, P4 family [Candidatus Binatia bacterium]
MTLDGVTMNPPKPLDVLPKNIPPELRGLRQWVAWRYELRDGKWTKPPLEPDGSGYAASTDPETWGRLSEALGLYRAGKAAGIGFALTLDCGFVGVDLDHCVRDGQLEPWAAEIVERFASYTERSPSGEGVRIFVKGSLPSGRRKKGNIEIYCSGRYLTVTGQRFENVPATIEPRQDAVDWLLANFLKEPERPKPSLKPVPAQNVADEVLLEKAFRARNGDDLRKLFEGSFENYPSQSEADLALCSRLAFWAQDPAQLDRLFRQSKLYRDDKWNSRRGGSTYGEQTIQKAWEGCSDHYAPGERRKPPGKESEKSEPLYLGEHLTDLGNARRFVRHQGKNFRFCEAFGWLLWDGRRWRKDHTGAVERAAKNVVASIYEEAANCEEKKLREALFNHAERSESERRIAAMISLAKSESDIALEANDFDQNEWLLNCWNGTIDLRTGELRSHDPCDLITKLVPIDFDPGAESPTWLTFLDTVFGGNAELIRFVQKAVGYSLTGSTREQVFFLLHGVGQNGKSTFVNGVAEILGDYAQRTPTETLVAKRVDSSISNDLARLAGARFVAATEIDRGRRLAEGLVKQITGSDPITARFMHREFFEFNPTFKLWFAANHKPRISGTDAIMRRVRLIPFRVKIEKVDRNLFEKLRTERAGILAWAVAGCIAWQREGLEPPAEIVAANEAYRQESDFIAPFLRDRCVLAPSAEVLKGEFYAAFKAWAEEAGERPISKRQLGRLMSERGFGEFKGHEGHVWRGVSLTTRMNDSGR